MNKSLYGQIIKIYNRIISTRLINKNNKVSRRIRAAIFHNICFETEASFGSLNPDRIFYVIRNPQDSMGLFAAINYVVYHLEKAMLNGYEPVVDWQYYPNKYFSEDKDVGRVNVWEIFFRQTTDISLKDVYNSKNVVMSSGDWDAAALGEVSNPDRLKKSHEIYQRYIHLNKDMEKKVEKEARRVGVFEHNVLGVKIRGTDFITTQPKDHSKVFDAELAIEKIEEKNQVWGEFDRIYLSTEDVDILNEMKKYYGERLYYTDSHSISCKEVGNRWLGDYMDNSMTDKIESMTEYLISTYILASVDYLIAPAVGGTVGAMRIKGQYKGLLVL